MSPTQRPRRGRPRPGGTRRSVLFRLRFGFLVIAMVLSLFGARLLQLQGLDPESYAAMAAREGTVTAELPAERGAILDRNGVELATSADGLMIVADPTMTHDDAPEIATRLADALQLDYFQTLTRLRKDDTRFQYIARRIPASIARKVVQTLEDDGFKGLSTRRDPMRDYPAHDVAANLVGFLGEDEALAGFERTFDKLLAGVDGEATYEVGGGYRIPLGDNTTEEPVDGEDLRLTIDRDVQWYAQRVLRSTVRKARGDSGVIAVMDTKTGELLALADHPTYDASDPLNSADRNRGARSASDVYEPGSVEKVLTFSALLDAGKITPRTRIVVPPEIDYGPNTIGDWWDHGTIHLTAAGALARSSNLGTIRAAEQFEPEELYDYLTDFGIGQPTGVGVRGESDGKLPPPETWTDLRQATIAFGQGMSVNAIQMTAAINTIANGGVRVSPNLVQGEATTDSGEVVGTATTTRDRVVSAEAARQTMQMMELVTDPEDGIAPSAAIPGYRVAGKTGTAQRVNKDCGCYDGTFDVSFAGFAPADDPRFTVYVLVRNPRNGGGGGSVGGPAFQTVMKYLLSKYSVPPTGTKPSTLPVEW